MLWQNIVTVGTLVLLEGFLSADNALVMAILVKHLPDKQRTRALRYGLAFAFASRLVCVLVASWLIKAWYFRAAGALYLIYIAFENLFLRGHHPLEEKKAKNLSFWKTVLVVELTNLAFSVDSILAAVALSPKIWVVYLGGVLGIVTMRYVAGGFLKLLDRFPGLEKGAYFLVGWIGLKLGLETCQEEITGFPHLMGPLLFWSVMVAIFFGSMLWKPKAHKHELPKELE